MTAGKKFKKKIRAQQAKMGGSYGAARNVVSPPPSDLFGVWLLTQVERDDVVGDLAKGARCDRQFPQDADARRVTAHLRSYGFHVRSALAEAISDWRATRRGGVAAAKTRARVAHPQWAETLRGSPVHAVTFKYGKSRQMPFGGEGVSTACRNGIDGEIVRRASFTLSEDRDKVTCAECRAMLDANGWEFSQGGMCASCDSYPREGHRSDCVFVRMFGCSTAPTSRPSAHE